MLQKVRLSGIVDYSPFGMVMPGRSFAAGSGYRFGFQSQELDGELWMGALVFRFRIVDPRLGRFFTIDPLASKFPYNSPYAFSENVTVMCRELEGKEKISAIFYGQVSSPELGPVLVVKIDYDLNTKIVSVAVGVTGDLGIKIDYNTVTNNVESAQFLNVSSSEIIDGVSDLGVQIPDDVVKVVSDFAVDKLGLFDTEIAEGQQALKEAGYDIDINSLIDYISNNVKLGNVDIYTKNENGIEVKSITNEDGTKESVAYENKRDVSLATPTNVSIPVSYKGTDYTIKGQAILKFENQVPVTEEKKQEEESD